MFFTLADTVVKAVKSPWGASYRKPATGIVCRQNCGCLSANGQHYFTIKPSR
ncbi:hypothetical protein MuYL_2079 [Mucilaginibacter xinganensis]|uniref:Uncharacterized protein n=1 Tax=Mucilaginibacter xinganensis TaxID=1234841 RepID=A0A223NWP5_9SPHI|nr:hypothetical protein MuYL_2079 [Mucilaginibacter xinganensis]